MLIRRAQDRTSAEVRARQQLKFAGSGDMVAAESYFQHAEHYNRIIMAAQSQMGVPNSSAGHNGDGGFHPRWSDDVSDRFGNHPGQETQSGDDGD